MQRGLAIGFCLLLTGCSAVGIHDQKSFGETDFGEREPLRICVLSDEGVSESLSLDLVDTIGRELARYGIEVTVPWVKPWKRKGFASDALIEQLGKESLVAPCDRIVAMIGRTAGDMLLGLIGFETLGAVDMATHTRAYVVAHRGSINQILISPRRVCAHEAYHLMGCQHNLTLSACYARIAQLKASARRNREAGNDFFPGIDADGRPILTRNDANWLIQFAIWRFHQRDENTERSCNEP